MVASDANLKNNLGNIENALSIVNAIDGIKYTWNDKAQQDLGYVGDKVEIGLIAQQLEQFVPELVMQNDDYKTVAYHRMVAVLVEAVKELSAKVEKLENK